MDAPLGPTNPSWPPRDNRPSNRSRKRFRFPAPLGSGPFRGPFFLRLGCGGIGGRWGRAYSGAMTTLPPSAKAETILRWIMVAVLVWGTTLAAGSWTFNHDIRRPIIVFACVVGFLGFWNVMLASRRRRLARGDRSRNPA